MIEFDFEALAEDVMQGLKEHAKEHFEKNNLKAEDTGTYELTIKNTSGSGVIKLGEDLKEKYPEKSKVLVKGKSSRGYNPYAGWNTLLTPDIGKSVSASQWLGMERELEEKGSSVPQVYTWKKPIPVGKSEYRTLNPFDPKQANAWFTKPEFVKGSDSISLDELDKIISTMFE